MNTEPNSPLENDSSGLVARALDGVADALRESLPAPAADLAGRGGGNLFHGLVQMRDRLAESQAERARVMARANSIARMDDLDITFEPSGSLGEAAASALDHALDVIGEVADRLRPEVRI